MFTSQMIVNGTAKPKEIVQTFRAPMGTVKRYMKVYRDYGAKGFYEPKPRHSSPAHRAQALHRYHQNDRLSRRDQSGFSAPRTLGAFRRCAHSNPADLRNRSGSSAGPECENVDRSDSPPHASGSRPGSRQTLLSAQRNPNDFSGYRPDAIFQNWLILNSRRSGGLNIGSDNIIHVEHSLLLREANALSILLE